MEVSFAKGVPATPVIDVEATVSPGGEAFMANIRNGSPEKNLETPSAPPTPPASVPVALPVQTSSVPSAAGPLAQRSQLLGDFLPDFSDIQMPRLNIVQNIGDLADGYPSGALVLNRDTELWRPPVIEKGVIKEPAPPPVQVIVVGFRPTRYAEKTTGGAKGRIFDSVQEVVAAGGTTEYAEAATLKKPLFQPLAEAVLLIKKPDQCNDPEGTVFSFEVPDPDGIASTDPDQTSTVSKWALALWSLKGTSYTAAGKKVLFKERRIGFLSKCGYPGRVFSLTTVEHEYDQGHAAWLPVLVAGRKTDAETLEWIKLLLS